MTFRNVAPLFALCACFAPTPRSAPCESNADCTLAGGGTCLPSPRGTAACAYPSTDCPSGFAWSELAPELEGECVAAAGPDGGDDDGATTVGEWGQPEYVLNVNTAVDELTPTASADHTRLYFSRGGDLYQATRATPADPWSLAARVPTLASATEVELSPEESPDGLELYLTINNRLHRATRPTLSDAWGAPLLLFPDSARSPALAADGLALYYVGGGWTVKRRARTGLAGSWGDAVDVAIPGAPTYDAVTVSADDRTLVLSSAINNDQPQVIELSRGSTTDPWGNLREAATLTRLQPTPRDCDFFRDADTMYCALGDGTNYNLFVVRRRLQ